MVLVCGTSTCHMAVSRSKLFIPGVWGPFWSGMTMNCNIIFFSFLEVENSTIFFITARLTVRLTSFFFLLVLYISHMILFSSSTCFYQRCFSTTTLSCFRMMQLNVIDYLNLFYRILTLFCNRPH